MAEGFVFPTREGRLALGVQARRTIPQPAAGADWIFTLPGGSWWRVLLARAIFSTSVAVANRIVGFEVRDSTAVLFRLEDANTRGAGTIANYSLMAGDRGVQFDGTFREHVMTFPDVLLPPGFIVRSNVLTIDAADQWSAVELLLEEYDLGPHGGPQRIHYPHNLAILEVD